MIQQEIVTVHNPRHAERSQPGPCDPDADGSASDPARGMRTRWSASRIARLGFLIGQGWDAKRIAGDPLIASTPNNVHRQAQRFGLAFREAVGLRLPADVGGRLDSAAAKRGLTREGLIRSLAVAAGSDAALLDNILDDDA